MASFRNHKAKVAALIFVYITTILILVSCRPDIPIQGWNDHWGPLVPHTTFPGDCGICHVPDRWDVLRKDFSFDHKKETGYALEDAHASALCLRCHNNRGPVKVYVARGCSGCHLDPHASSLGLDCERCHNQRTWQPMGLIAEHARTRFPLYGAHAVAPCESCHLGAPAGQFRGAATECELCHQSDLARATSPDHLANGWTTDCQRCHTTTLWQQAVFSHDIFPLTNGHAGLNCVQCHTGGTFGTIPSDCYSCHSADYAGAPDHSTLNLSHDCEQCHGTSAWTPSSFVHTFPLTGNHNLSCTECHNTGSTSVFSCIDCHTHNATDTADHHSGVSGYSYNSSACYSCHPNGRAD